MLKQISGAQSVVHHKFLGILIICLITLLNSSSAETDADGLKLPEDYLPQLDEILKSAQINAPSLIEESFLQKEGEQRLLQAKSDYYPRIDLGANLGSRSRIRSEGENTNDLGFTYNARLSRPLYHWGAIEARIEQARINNDTDTLNYLENTRLVFREIRSDYLTLILNQIALKNEILRRTNLQEDLERIEVDYSGGKISELNYKKHLLDLNNSLQTIDQIERSQKLIMRRFQATAGWNKPYNSSEKIPDLDLPELEEWLSHQINHTSINWIEQNYETVITKNELKKQEEAFTIIQARQRPLLNFTASATQDQTNTSTANNVDTLTLFAGLSVSWNIFDGFQTKHQKIEVKLKQRRLKSKLERIENELQLKKIEMLDSIQFQISQTDLLKERYELENKFYEQKQNGFKTGRLTKNELRRAQLELSELELNLATAQANLLLTLSEYNDLIVSPQFQQFK